MSKENKELNALKEAADYYDTVVFLLNTRIKYAPEEFQGISNTINFIASLASQVKAAIEKIEPKKVEAVAPLEMDLSHVTAEKPKLVAEFN